MTAVSLQGPGQPFWEPEGGTCSARSVRYMPPIAGIMGAAGKCGVRSLQGQQQRVQPALEHARKACTPRLAGPLHPAHGSVSSSWSALSCRCKCRHRRSSFAAAAHLLAILVLLAVRITFAASAGHAHIDQNLQLLHTRKLRAPITEKHR